MVEKFFRSVLDSYHHRFVSRRLILIIDLITVAFSFSAACILRFNFTLSDINWPLYKYYLLFLILIRWGCFLAFRSYHGIIRHTSLEDMRLIFRTVSLSSLLVSFVSVLAAYAFNEIVFYIPVSVLLIEYFICLFLMIASRFFVKSMYQDIARHSSRTQPQQVLIYGAGSLGILTRDVLLKDPRKAYGILGFIDDNPTLINKSVAGVRVMNLESAYERCIRKSPSRIEIILAIQHISTKRKKEILEYFLQHNVVVKVVPSANEWLEGTLSSGQIRKIRIEDLLERDPIRLDNPNIQKHIEGQVVAITGAAGSIGSEIARQILHYRPRKLVMIDQSESGLYDLEFELRNQYTSLANAVEIESFVGSVTNEIRMRRAFALHQPQIVFHAAAYKHVPLMERYPYEAIQTNTLGTKIVADLAVQFQTNKFVLVSTDKAVNPTNVMGATKRLAEMYVQGLNSHGVHTTDFIITRFGNVLGSNGSVVPLFRKQIQAGGPVTVTHPDVIRYFMTIPEACQLVLEAGAMGKGGDVFVFDMGEPVRIEDLARRMIQLSGLVVGRDIKIVYSGLRPGEKLYEELLSQNELHLPTHHPKILIARLPPVLYPETEAVILELKKALPTGDRDAMVAVLKASIPEYISRNSEFEKLDRLHEDLSDPA
jgi:FlaA1/EpsC-like NDP-sugar epimerase